MAKKYLGVGLRLWSIIKKEFLQLIRDPYTFALLLFIPSLQAFLFGVVINTDPKHLPTLVVSADYSDFTQSFIAGLQNTQYFKVTGISKSEQLAENALDSGKTQFVVNIPPNFSHDLVRGVHPHILIEADATDPMAVTNAFQAARSVANTILNRDFQGTLQYLIPADPAFTLDLQAKYNPDNIIQYNTLPGILAAILCTTLVILSAVSITSEFELGTMETLLTTPARPIEIIFGKIITYLWVGYLLLFFMQSITYFFFQVPFIGSFWLYLFVSAFYFISSIATGLLISTTARNQVQAITIGNSYLLPSLLLSGFLFPFRGMPAWAQTLGNILPITHFMRITRGIMLKGNSWQMIWSDFYPILIFSVIVILISVNRFRETLD